MAEFTKEQLINLARENVRVLKQAAMQHKVQPVIAMDLRLAEIALAALTAGMEQEPAIEVSEGDALSEIFAPGTKLYAAPQLPQPAVAITQHFDTIALDTAKMVMCDVNRRDEFLGGDIQLLSRIQCRIDEACRAAMLQSAEHSKIEMLCKVLKNAPLSPSDSQGRKRVGVENDSQQFESLSRGNK